MKKTTIYLTEDLDIAIAAAAGRGGVAKAEFIRRALTQALDGEIAPRLTGIGAVSGAPADLAEHDERHLAQSRFGDA